MKKQPLSFLFFLFYYIFLLPCSVLPLIADPILLFLFLSLVVLHV